MIRIDEIYNNIFIPFILKKERQSIHFFDPFGKTDFNSLKSLPKITNRDKSFLIWDQEPFIPDIHYDTINEYHNNFVSPFHHDKRFKHKRTPDLTKTIFVTSEKNSTHTNELCADKGYDQVYYFFHAWAALDWYRGYNRSNLTEPYSNREINNTFISPNRIVGGNRYHRLELFKSMVKNNLIENNKVSFPKYCPYSNEEIIVEGAELPLLLDGETTEDVTSCSSSKIDIWRQARNSLLQVVTETVYKEDTLHLTEKIFRPIVMQMPFVLVGAKNNLEYLRSYGFKTFGEFWDESYDNMENDQRIGAVTKLLVDLNSLSLKEKAQLQKHLAPTVEHNFNWFYSNEFENLLWKELTDMMKQW